ncbi:MAG: DUF1622 domain-containing protein [Cyanobacteria bacterium P01_A01_bin.40]
MGFKAMFWLYFAIANEATQVERNGLITKFNHLAEGLLLETAILFKIVIEGIAIFILALAIVKAVQELVFRNARMDREEKLAQVRLDLGVALALSLEFLLAADIAATAVSPSWNAVGKLAAISAIRTFLNFFLDREVKDLAKERLEKLKDQTF